MKNSSLSLSLLFFAIGLSNANAQDGRVIGMGYDNQAQANIFLYDDSCRIASHSRSYPYRFDAKIASTGQFLAEGCYSFNQQSQQVFLIGNNGNTAMKPMASFQGGQGGSTSSRISDALNALSQGIARTQQFTQPPPPVQNMSPGMTRGNNNYTLPGYEQKPQVNCTTSYYGNQAYTSCR